MNLNSSLQNIKGVGPKTGAQLAAAGLNTVNDLLNFLPRRFDDFSQVVAIADLSPGKQTIKARCESIKTRPARRGMRVTTAVLADDSGKVKAVWFNQPYRATQLTSDKQFYFSGNFEFSYNHYQLTNPSAELVSDLPVQTDRLLPIYPAIKGLKSQLVRKILAEIKPLIALLPETLPPQIVAEQKLLSRSETFQFMHFPKDSAQIAAARERLAFEELFSLLLASQFNKQLNSQLKSYKITFSQPLAHAFIKKLPFKLTDAQRLAAWQILQDFEKSAPMNRLLQGDVGSGKTVVAGLAAAQAAQAGFQTAFMAPTEILAHQHASTLSNLLQPLNIKVGLATGSVKTKQRAQLNQQIESGAIDIIVGTHALIYDSFKPKQLGFVVIDEQHRFGVEQRQKLLAKSKYLPHLLTMTATPIPRSLALTLYGELDISVLNELPAGRRKIITKIVSPNSQAQAYSQINQQLNDGRQAYIICSLIDDNPQLEAKSAKAEFDKLRQTVFKNRRVGLMHGKLDPEQKSAVMNDFLQHKIDVLVSTTVVEVGVDVPNASVILIENADKFGLSQLHQLRGRVGRAEHQSYCFLVTSDSQKPTRRLKEIEKSQDGFYLAEVDLALRGPGEIYGKNQHGALNLQIAKLSDSKLMARALDSAQKFVQSGQNLLQYEQLATQVHKYQRLTSLN